MLICETGSVNLTPVKTFANDQTLIVLHLG
jgi:hypothetical protein